jgi:hypothetical protein
MEGGKVADLDCAVLARTCRLDRQLNLGGMIRVLDGVLHSSTKKVCSRVTSVMAQRLAGEDVHFEESSTRLRSKSRSLGFGGRCPRAGYQS